MRGMKCRRRSCDLCTDSGMFLRMGQAIGTGTTVTDWREELVSLVEEYRDRCLWFARTDFMPQTPEQILRTIDQIERYGDRAAYEHAEAIKRWLRAPSRA